MDEDWHGLEWVVDVVAASMLAAASGWSAAYLLQGPLSATAIPLVAFLASLKVLRAVKVGDFELRKFEPATWEVSGAGSSTGMEEAADAEQSRAADPKVVRFSSARPSLPSAGEMQERIEQHLRERRHEERSSDNEVALLGADASAALRRAIGELKRALP